MARGISKNDDTPKRTSREILDHQILEGLAALRRPTGGLFISGLSAGLEIGFSLFLMATILTLVGDTFPAAVTEMLVANMYAVGFILVVLGRSELFTEHTALAVLPTLSGEATLLELGRLWGVVYVSNLIGAIIFSGLVVMIGPALEIITPSAFGKIALPLVKHGAWVILLSATLAGWLMGLLSWVVTAGRDTISQIVIVWFITSTIGLGHLHHSIVGTTEVVAAILADQSVGWGDYGRFLLWTTLGNAVGGVVFVALIKYSHAVQEER